MDERIRRMLAVGKEHYESGDFPQAEEVLSQIVEENRGFADIHNMLGVIYHAQGKFSQAQECFEEALSINPHYTEAALNLSVTYNDLGQYDEARKIYADAMSRSKAEPRSLDPFAKGKIANMHANLGDAYHGLGFSLAMTGEAREATVMIERAVRLSPNDPFMYAFLGHLGQAYFQLGEYDSSIERVGRSLELRPTPGLTLLLAASCGLSGRHEEGQEVLARFEKSYPDFSPEALRHFLPAFVVEMHLDGLRKLGWTG